MKFNPVLTLIFILFLIPYSSASLISNGNFELTEVNDINFCCDGLTGCGNSSSPVRVPLYWDDVEYGNHIQSISTNVTENYGLKIFTHKPSNCTMWAGGCTQVNITNGGLAEYDQTFEVQNDSFAVTFDVRKCTEAEEPIKCNGLFEDQAEFMGDTNEGLFIISTEWDNGTATNTYSQFGTAQDFFQTFSYDFSTISFSNSTSFPQNITLSIGSAVNSYWGDESSCVVFDELEVEYSEGTNASINYTNITEVFDYINDMTNYRTFPSSVDASTGIYSGRISDFDMSSAYDGLPLGTLNYQVNVGGSGCSQDAWENGWIEEANIYYNDGTSRDVQSSTSLYVDETDDCVYRYTFYFPIPNVENVDIIQMASLHGDDDGEVNITIEEENAYIRNDWDDEIEITTWETISGNSHLYPVILYNASWDEADNITFRSYNFLARRTEDLAQNLRITQYESDGDIKNLVVDSATIGYGYDDFEIECLYDAEPSDYVIVEFYSERDISNTTYRFDLDGAEPPAFCEDYCDTDFNFYDGYIDEYGICQYEVFENSSSCYPVYTPEEEEAEGIFATGEATASLFGFDNATGLFFIAMILVVIFTGLGTAIISKGVKLDSSGFTLVFFVQFLAWFLVFTLAGLVPSWITIIMMVLTTFILGLWFKKGLAGG